MNSALCLCLLLPVAAVAQEKNAWEGKTVQEWIGQLSHHPNVSAIQDVALRWYAAYALGQLGAEAAEAVEPLVKILSSGMEEGQYENEHLRGMAAWTLGRIGPKAAAAVPVLTAALVSRHRSVQRNAPRALGAIGAAAAPAIPGLLKLLAQGDDAEARVNAAVALWQIQRHPKAIPALTAMVREGKDPAAYQAADALGRLEADAEAVAPPLIEALAAADADVRRAAIQALGRLGAAATPALKNALKASEPDVPRSAVEALGRIGAPAVPELTAALKHRQAAVRRAAARALGRLGAAAKRAEPALVEAVNDADRDVRDAAAKALKSVRAESS